MELVQVLANVFQPLVLMMIFTGVIMGRTIFGGIPGLSTPIALALILPVIYKMDTVLSICLMIGIYCGGVSGGLVSAILLKIPGSAAAVATTFDGYPMAQKGYGAGALSIGVFASFFVGTLSCLLLIMAPALAKLALEFGPWEYFGNALMALVYGSNERKYDKRAYLHMPGFPPDLCGHESHRRSRHPLYFWNHYIKKKV